MEFLKVKARDRLPLLGWVTALFLAPPLVLSLCFGFRVATHRTLSVHSVTTVDQAAGPVRVPAEASPKILIHGTGMDSTCQVRLHPRYDYQASAALNPATLESQLPADLRPGLYDVVVRNSRGHTALLREAVDIYWIPRLKRVFPARTYAGEVVEITGSYLQANAAVWLGQRRIKGLHWISPERLQLRLPSEEELPPGVYDLRLSNGHPDPGSGTSLDERLRRKVPDPDPAESEVTLPRAVQILSRPRTTEIYPAEVTYGQELTVRGEHFPEECTLLLEPFSIPLKTTRVDSALLRAVLIPEKKVSGLYDLYLTVPDGVPILLQRDALSIESEVSQPVAVEVSLEAVPNEVLDRLKLLPGWKGMAVRKRVWKGGVLFYSGKAPPLVWVVRMVLPAALRGDRAGGSPRKLVYRGFRLRRGSRVPVWLAGQELDGLIVSDPQPVLVGSDG